MHSIMRADASGTVHASNLDSHNAATACGIVGGAWVSTMKVVTCRSCIRIMVSQVAKNLADYRGLLQEAIYPEVVKPTIRSIEPMNDSYDSLEIRWIKEKISELVEVVNALVEAHIKGV